MTAARRAFFTALLLSTIPVSGMGCAACEKAGMVGLSLMGGTINDPANKSLRRGMMSFALDRACKEMLERPAALREGGELSGSATNPTNGRFFPKTCTQSEAANGDLIMSFSGVGYSYSTGVHKVTFEASGQVQYDQDFLMHEDQMYAYFRTKEIQKSIVHVKVIESTLPSIANQLTGFGDKYGRQLLSERLRDGFTVRRKSNSETDFRAGIVQLGSWPVTSYHSTGQGLVVANDRTEVHEQQRDFLGPFKIDDSDETLFVTLKIDGAPALNVLVVDDDTAKAWMGKYLTVGDATPPPSKPLALMIAKQNEELRFTAGDTKGTFWIVLDNTGTIAGGAKPPGNLLDDRAAVVSYAIVLADKKK